MSEINNSLSSVVDNLIKLQRNNTEILTKLTEVVNSDADVVTLTIEDIANDNIKTVTIPSLGALQKNIERLDENITQISALNNKEASVQLPDGTFRTIITSSLKKNADDIQTVQSPTEFESKNNWFFESFLNPFLYVGFNFPTQLNPDTIKVQSQKFILDLDNDEKLRIFNEQLKNNPDLLYADFLDIINTNGILYTIDDDILDLPPVEPRFYGNFSVLRVFESNETVIVNGEEATKKVQKFQLDKLTYSDKNSNTLETQQLKIGDSLLVNKNEKNTRYFITNIDFETTTLSVELAEGYDSVNIGADILSFYPSEDIVPEIQVGVGFNEYISLFLKPIDPDSNRPADNFSPAISFYSNELTIKDTDDIIKSLETYYQEKVVDFGAVLFSLSQENIPPVSKAVVPDAPSLTSTDFKVVQINRHVTDGQSNEDIKSLNKEKLSLNSQLGDLDKAISTKRQEISTKNYKSDIERDSDSNQLNTLIEKRAATESLYNSVISDILGKAQDKTTSSAAAKYRIRGFWPVPNNKLATDGSEQNIIQFKIEYRYLTKGGAANNLEEFDYTDNQGNIQKGVYSNWEPRKSPLRERAFDPNTGKYFWVDQNTENGEAVNINQLDIAIRPNETVELRIKSISEAGYPSNPIESEWSEILPIEFPDDLGVSEDILAIVKETSDEQVKVQLSEDLNEKGVFVHIDDQFIQNNFTWKHQAANIASGFLSQERNVISLLDYLKRQDEKIAKLEAEINKTLGIILVKLEDENGNQKIIQDNTTVTVNAGNYKDEVSSLDLPKGIIITKNYFIRIENDAATPIQLVSSFSPSNLNFSGSKFEKISSNNYNKPILGISNPDESDLLNQEGTAFSLPYQSSQVKGQFAYVRATDVTTTKTIYEKVGNTPLLNMYSFEPISSSGATGNYKSDNTFFIWSGSQPSTNEVVGFEPFPLDNDKTYVHCSHPDLNEIPQTTNQDWINDNTTISKFSNLRFGVDTNYYQQCTFLGNNNTGTVKTAFRENDKFLIGSASCGCYLYVSPINYESIRVSGNDNTSNKELEKGSDNAIIFQVVYQYRMTDYFGPGNTGIGRIGGDETLTQLEYRKTIGLDIYYDEKKFAFDIEVISRYKSNTIGSNDVPSVTFQNTINPVTNNVNQVTPNL